MAGLETPGEVLKNAREARGWSHFEAGRRAGIGDQQLKNLEVGKTEPSEAKLKTILRLVAVYWPDVQLSELVEETPFDATPCDAAAATLLGSKSSSPTFLSGLRERARR